MNELLYRKTGKYNMQLLPDMPNFLDAFVALQEGNNNSFIERGTVTEVKKQCDRGCGDDEKIVINNNNNNSESEFGKSAEGNR